MSSRSARYSSDSGFESATSGLGARLSFFVDESAVAPDVAAKASSFALAAAARRETASLHRRTSSPRHAYSRKHTTIRRTRVGPRH
jgi:hypothetical protein